jgi:hypothetical protein
LCPHRIELESITLVDMAYYDEVTGVLRGLLIRLSDRLPRPDQVLVSDFIDANELGLALEQMADTLSEDDRPISDQERADMLGLAERMQMDGRVSRALAFCPEA